MPIASVNQTESINNAKRATKASQSIKADKKWSSKVRLRKHSSS